MAEAHTLSAELAAMAAALQDSHRTGYTVPVIRLIRAAERARELEQLLAKEQGK